MNILPKRRIKNPASQQEIATTNRNTRKAYSLIAATLIPFPAYGLLSKVIGRSTAMGAKKMGDNIRFTKGMTMSGIKSAFKKAGSIGNTKKPDTIGNRFKQSQAIMGKSPKDKPFGSRTSMAKQDEKRPASLNNPMLGTVMGTSASRKYYRTLTNAIEQGPSKFFSSGRSAKTGITPGKRSLTDKKISLTYKPVRSIKGERIPRRKKGADGGTSRGSLLRHNDPYSLKKYRKYNPMNFLNFPDDI
jgi:hypothetical protein